MRRAQRTLLGGIGLPAGASGGRGPSQQTLLGVAAPFAATPESLAGLSRTQVIPKEPARPADADTTQPGFDPFGRGGRVDDTAATIVDAQPLFDNLANLKSTQPIPAGPTAGSPPSRSGGTLLGVARPGIAPLRPGVAKTASPAVASAHPPAPQPAQQPARRDDPPQGYSPLEELGATQHPAPHISRKLAAEVAQLRAEGAHPLGRRRFDKAIRIEKVKRDKPDPKTRSNRRVIAILAAASALVIGAIVTVLLWPASAPLTAQVRAGDGGTEVLDLVCESCPDGTVLKSRYGEATVKAARASLPLSPPLKIGDTPVKVSIDRPGRGRDESVELPARVAYRIKPDLTTLEGDHPSLSVVIEAMEGATVSLDGEPVSLRDGNAVKAIDVSRDLAGPSGDPSAQLTRKISFVVKPPDGAEEKGVVAVSVPILPLTVDAPGRAIVTEKPTFVLAGHTAPGAEIVVAGRSLGVSKDGAFSQTMNVSSVGATEIEVRAKTPGRAPRLVRISVERVSTLAQAVDQFTKRSPVDYSTVADNLDAAVGRPVALSGEVLEAAVNGPTTTMILSADAPSCKERKCIVRLVQGRSDLEVGRGAKLRAFGVVDGSVQHEGAKIPDVDVAFSIVDAVAPGKK